MILTVTIVLDIVCRPSLICLLVQKYELHNFGQNDNKLKKSGGVEGHGRVFTSQTLTEIRARVNLISCKIMMITKI